MRKPRARPKKTKREQSAAAAVNAASAEQAAAAAVLAEMGGNGGEYPRDYEVGDIECASGHGAMTRHVRVQTVAEAALRKGRYLRASAEVDTEAWGGGSMRYTF